MAQCGSRELRSACRGEASDSGLVTPGAPVRAAASVVTLAAALQDPATVPRDTAVVESPLPGGVAEVVRFLLNTVPAPLQMAGAVIGAVAGAFILYRTYRNRAAIRGWIATRSRGVRIAMAAVLLVLGAGMAGFSAAAWNYTQHSNEFCVGCHVMNPAFHKFADDDNKHGQLSCHDCHQQSLYASARQMYLWIAERPVEIGEHAKVPNRVCMTCHVTAEPERWQRIAGTAGHRVHLESDSTALKDLQCVTCHGVEVHRFRPVAATCGQSGCHDVASTGIVLGKMAGQTVRHCTSCHGFTEDVPALATVDSARGTMVPGRRECMSCHEMRAVLTDFQEGLDPHGGKCGTCHNPHTQERVAEAATTCATSGCHSNWRDNPFHAGTAHRAVGSQCIVCHTPHSAKVDASGCEDCHQRVRARGGSRQPPVRFDTSAALRRGGFHSSAPPLHYVPVHRGDPGAALGSGDTPSPDVPEDPAPEPQGSGVLFAHTVAPDLAPLAAEPVVPGPRHSPANAAPADSFPHARHTSLACLVCHQTGSGHGRLTFERPRGCSICHHQAPAEARCESCHRTEVYGAPRSVRVTVAVPAREPRARPVDYVHAQHAARRCVECHTEPVTLGVLPAKAQCRDCHTEHHAPERTCASCHGAADPKSAHTNPITAHQRCDACHTRTIVEQLSPTRSFCSTCHSAQQTRHYEPRECTVCHFLVEPAVYRHRLVGGGR